MGLEIPENTRMAREKRFRFLHFAASSLFSPLTLTDARILPEIWL